MDTIKKNKNKKHDVEVMTSFCCCVGQKNFIKKVSQVKSKLHFPICETKKMKEKESIGMSFWSSHQLYLSFLAYVVVRSFSIFDLTTLHRALLLHGAVHLSKKVVKII